MSFEIVPHGTAIDFLGRWRICATISFCLILISLAAIPLRGFRLGIDFAGGTELQVRFADEAQAREGDIRAVMQDLGIAGASVIRYGDADSNEFLLKFAESVMPATAPVPDVAAGEAAAAGSVEAVGDEPAAAAEPVSVPEAAPPVAPTREGVRPAGDAGVDSRVDELTAALGERIGPLEVERVEFVGPKVGAELRRAGILALSLACVLILAYIAFRFSARFAPGAVVALVHDVLITSGIWVLLGLEFDLRVLAALLAIVGYSLNDTIIVYDRIRENLEVRTRRDFQDVLNESVNATLSRTLLTSLTTMVAVLALLFLGGEVIRPFALAMTIGIVVGTYSSIYVAAPTLLFLENRFGGPPKPARA